MYKTKVLKINPFNPDENLIKEAAEFIKKGEIVAFPTETVYGLGADATNSYAVKKIFKAKGRPIDNPIIVHINDFNEIENVAVEIPEITYKIIEKFWPGPLTLILKRKKNIVPETSAGLETVAIRMPSHPIAKLLIKFSEKPIAAPSANKSGKPSPTTAEHVLEDFKNEIPIILDSGKTFHGVESTVIDITKKPPLLLRPGAIPVEEIKKIVKKIVVNEIALGTKKINKEEKVVSPGLKYRHYAPTKPLILVEGEENKKIDKIKEIIKKNKEENKKIGLIISEENRKVFENLCDEILILGKKENLFTVAFNLFSKLREMDRKDVDIILCEGFVDKGIGLTIMNRLRKASSKRIIVK